MRPSEGAFQTQAHPERILLHLAGALNEVISSDPRLYDGRFQENLAQRASFHLLSPMIESYFFADSASLQAAGVADLSSSIIDPLASDVENFNASLDEAYRKAKCTPPTAPWSSTPPSPPWEVSYESSMIPKEYHPKAYLKYLVEQSSSSLSTYKETTHGLEALKLLRWETVLIPLSHVTYLRSLLTEIAVFLDDEFPQGETAPLTDPSRLWKEKTKLLRNLPKNP